MEKEEIELAEQHVSLAEDIVNAQAKDADEGEVEKLKDAELSLEKAEANLEEVSEDKK